MSKRAHLSLETKLASALLALGHFPYSHAKLMTAAQIISLYHFDHYPIRKADGGPDEPWNLQPLGIIEHRRKTGDIDKPQLAKSARLRGETCTAPGKPIRSRPFSKQQRPLRSRNTFERRVP